MAHWIKHKREALRLSQEDLAARLQVQGFDITRGTVSHWETGRHNPPLDNPEFAKALAAVLRMTTTELFNSAGYNLFDDNLSELARKAAVIVEQMPPEKQSMAIGILEQILNG